jgi:hypothetical protein
LVPFFDDYANGKYIEIAWQSNPVMIVAGVALYLVGQVAIWLYWLKQGQPKDRNGSN